MAKKAVYLMDSNKHFSGIKLVDDDYQAQANETLVKPEDGLYEPITWNGTGWTGTDKETWEASQPKVEIKPTQSEKLLAVLVKDVASVKIDNKSQNTLNANVMKELANQKLEQAKVNATILKQLADIKNGNKETA